MDLLDPTNAPFVAKLTAKSSSGGVWLYSWEEYQGQATSATRIQAYPGRQGTSTVSPARELNNQETDINVLVLMWCRGMVSGQLAYEFSAADGSLSTDPASLTQYHIAFGSAVNLLTSSANLTYDSSRVAVVGDMRLDRYSSATPHTAGSYPLLEMRRAGSSSPPTPSATPATARLGRWSLQRYDGAAWSEVAYINFDQASDGSGGVYRQAILTARSDIDAAILVEYFEALTPASRIHLKAEQTNIGTSVSGSEITLGVSDSLIFLGPVGASKLVGTTSAGIVQDVTVGSGLTYDDAAGTLVATATSYTDEMARDAIGTALTNGTGISITVNDGADTITIATTITQYTDEMARDALGTALTEGYLIDITVNDGSDTITLEKKFRGCRAYRSGSGSTPGYGSAWGSVAFDAENYDTDAIHDNSTNNSRFTIPTGMGGYWRFTGRIYPDPAGNVAGTVVQVRLLLNGATILDVVISEVLTSGSVSISIVQTVRSFSAGDYVELQMYHTGAGAMTYINNDILTWMECEFQGVAP